MLKLSKGWSMPRPAAALVLILTLGLALRLLMVIFAAPYPERFVSADAVGYDQLAINLVSGNGFSRQSAAPYAPDNFRTPIYPMFVSSVYAIFGHKPALVLYLQIIIGSATILSVYFIGKFISGPKLGLIAAAFLAVSMHSITYTALLWSDTLFTLVLTLSILTTVIAFVRLELKWILLSGFLLGVATLIHPRSLYIALFFGLLLLAAHFLKRLPISRGIVYTSLYLGTFFLTLLPWYVRNYQTFGVPNLTSAPGINMLFYGAALTEATLTGEDQWSIGERYDAQVRQMNEDGLNEAEFARQALQFAIDRIVEHPLVYAKVHLIGSAKVFLPGSLVFSNLVLEDPIDTIDIYSKLITGRFTLPGMFAILSSLPAIGWSYVVLNGTYLVLVYLLVAVSIVTHYRSLSWSWFFLAIVIYLAVVAGAAGAPRFRVAIMPFLSLIAAFGFITLIRVLPKVRKPATHGNLVHSDDISNKPVL